MLVYRIAISSVIKDLSGEGTRRYGSRWTAVGIPVLYTAENRALAVLEFYVHGKTFSILTKACLATIEIPSDVSIQSIGIPDLPAYWRNSPAPNGLQAVSKQWIKSGEFVLKIPSVLIPNEYNFILNTDHPDMKRVKLVDVQNFTYDSRL